MQTIDEKKELLKELKRTLSEELMLPKDKQDIGFQKVLKSAIYESDIKLSDSLSYEVEND